MEKTVADSEFDALNSTGGRVNKFFSVNDLSKLLGPLRLLVKHCAVLVGIGQIGEGIRVECSVIEPY